MPIRHLNADQFDMARSFLGPVTAQNAMIVTLLEQEQEQEQKQCDSFGAGAGTGAGTGADLSGANPSSVDSSGSYPSGGCGHFWGDFDASGRLRALVANEHNRWMLWHHEDDCADVDWRGIADVITASGQPFYYKGPFDQWQALHRIVGAERAFTRVSFILSKLVETSAMERGIERGSGRGIERGAERGIERDAAATTQVRQCTREHLQELARFYEQAGSMRRSLAELEKIMNRQQRFYAIWEEERIVSAAFTEFEGDDFASIICVFTDPSRRRLGYSESCVHELTRALWLDGKIAWLYWNNPAAGRIYRRLGYRPESLWIRCNYDAAPLAEGMAAVDCQTGVIV